MILTVLIIIATVVLDRWTKWLAAVHLKDGAFRFIPDVLHFTYVENRGAAFGMLKDHRWVFMVVSVAAIAGIIVFISVKKPKNMLLLTSLALIAGGGIGNMIDRTALGYVIDMIDVTCIDFYVFNVADSAVCIGCGLLILYMILDEVKTKRKAK